MDIKKYTEKEVLHAMGDIDSKITGRTITGLKRLANQEPVLSTNFMVSPPDEKGLPWKVRSVIRDEFMNNAMITLNIRKGITATDTIVVLKYLESIILNAQKLAKKDYTKKRKYVKNMNILSFWDRISAGITALFNLPAMVINRVVELIKK